MTLADVTLPVTYQWGCDHALVFGPSLAQRLAEVHAQYGDPTIVPNAVPLTDGRFMLTADILTECVGGFLAVPFSHLDASRFDEIEVVPIADALALLPPDPPEPTAPASSPTLSPTAAPSGGGTLAPGVAPSLGGAIRR